MPSARSAYSSPSNRNVKLNSLARHQFAVIALAAIALLSSFWWLLDVITGYSNASNTFGVASFEERFQPLRKILAPHSTVGYASDNPYNNSASLGEFYLTQYTLAPTIVTEAAPSKGMLVVVNSHSPQPDLRKLQAQHLALVQNIGGGVLLCRRNEQ